MVTVQEIFDQNLDEDQQRAASDTSNEILCLACAGSGKSRTLAFRIVRLLMEGVEAKSILAFTFTKKAAESIKLRVSSALSAAGLPTTLVGAMYIGTIHGWCKEILGEMNPCYRQFDVLDDNKLILFLISRYLNLQLHRLRADRGARYFQTVNEVSKAWKTLNDEMIDLETVRREDEYLGETLVRLKDRMEQDQFTDFSSMIRIVAEEIQNSNETALRAINHIKHVMVDEYQDVNPAQQLLVSSLQEHTDTLFVVGDDDQSIYAWRGADVNHILNFQQEYPSAVIHTLSKNYRSTEPIVDTSNRFVQTYLGPRRMEKNPVSDDATHRGPRDFRVIQFSEREHEAVWVARRIRSLLGAKIIDDDEGPRGLTPGDFAILMRSTRQSEGPRGSPPRHAAFTEALRNEGIELSLESGGSVFDTIQVEALRESFELLREGNPDRNECMEVFQTSILPAYPQADFEVFTRVISEWGRLIHGPTSEQRRRVFPQKLVYELLEAFRLRETELSDVVLHHIGIFSRIIQDVESVYVSIDTRERYESILNFLSNTAESGYDIDTMDAVTRPDAVTVSTVHKMKGLEFPVVFIVDMQAQRFPRNRSRYRGWLPQSVIQEAVGRGAYHSTRDEEIRLFYTAMTRAERWLYVTCCEQLPRGRRRSRMSEFAASLAHDELRDDPDIEETTETTTPRRKIEDSPLPTSFSEIKYYLVCPRDYLFRKVFGFSPPIVEMFGFGQTVHATIGTLHNNFPDDAPTSEEAGEVADDVFHLKHVYPSGEPEERVGPYERAKNRSKQIVQEYATSFQEDFQNRRQVEIRFEIPLPRAVLTGAIDLMIQRDNEGNIVSATVVDFKTLEDSEQNPLDWTSLALQVQLYANAANEVLGHNARTGAVHLLKDNNRVQIPVDERAVQDALSNVNWAVENILAGEYPMRPARNKCDECDFRPICPRRSEDFSNQNFPPTIHISSERRERVQATRDSDI